VDSSIIPTYSWLNDSSTGIFHPEQGIISFTSNTQEVMRINNSLNVLVGYSSDQIGCKLQVNGQIFSTSSVIATSDEKYKTNIQPLDNILDLVNNLIPVSFEWKQHPIHNFNKGIQLGFIAQDIKDALSNTPFVDNIVTENKVTLPDNTEETFLGLKESSIITLLTRALQELSHKLNKLEDEFKLYKESHQ
jgi:hypothetical protein